MNCCVLTPESVAETIMAPWTFDGQLTVHAVVLFWTKISVINSPLVRFVNVGEIVEPAVVQENCWMLPFERSKAGVVENATEFSPGTIRVPTSSELGMMVSASWSFS